MRPMPAQGNNRCVSSFVILSISLSKSGEGAGKHERNFSNCTTNVSNIYIPQSNGAASWFKKALLTHWLFYRTSQCRCFNSEVNPAAAPSSWPWLYSETMSHFQTKLISDQHLKRRFHTCTSLTFKIHRHAKFDAFMRTFTFHEA